MNDGEKACLRQLIQNRQELVAPGVDSIRAGGAPYHHRLLTLCPLLKPASERAAAAVESASYLRNGPRVSGATASDQGQQQRQTQRRDDGAGDARIADADGTDRHAAQH